MPIAASKNLDIDNNARNNISGDVKSGDDWDIWGDDAVLDED
jgi:hypothetical protein